MLTASKSTNEPARAKRAERAVKLLRRALRIVDQLEDRPEVGARLQALIDELRSDD